MDTDHQSQSAPSALPSLERVFDTFSGILLPVIIVMLAIVVVVIMPSRYPSFTGSKLELRALPTAAAQQTPEAIYHDLMDKPTQHQVQIQDNSWVLFQVPNNFEPSTQTIRFGPALISHLTCTNLSNHSIIGGNNHTLRSATKLANYSGYLLESSRLQPNAEILCNVGYFSPNYLSVEQWDRRALLDTGIYQTHNIALLEGGVVALALMLLVIAISNRQPLYLLLSAWLLGNLRLGAMAMGWDEQWLGASLPLEWLPLIQRFTLAVYFLISYNLFSLLLRPLPNSLLFKGLLWALRAAGILLLITAFVGSPSTFSSLMWLASLLGLGTMLSLALRNIRLSQNRVPLWQLVLISGGLCIVIAGVFVLTSGYSTFVNTFTGVTAFFLSNLMVSLLLADRIYSHQQLHVQTQQALQTSYTHNPLAMFTLQDGVFQRVNTSLQRVLGIENFAADTHHWEDFFPPVDWHDVLERSKQNEDTEIKRHADLHTHLPHHFSLRAFRSGNKIEGTLQDDSARLAAMQQLHQIADNDPITNSLNQRGLEKALQDALDSLLPGQHCVLGYLDLNVVKHVNSTHGHAAGNALLKEVSLRLERLLTGPQEVGRLVGDEFVLIFGNVDIPTAQHSAKEILSLLNASTVYAANRGFNLHSTLGLVEVPAGTSAEDALSAASRACREARRNHKSLTIYRKNSQELHDHAEELKLFKDLENGHSSGMFLEMQPILDLARPLQTLNFEVLLRVRDSIGELIPSGKIIAAAEESGTVSIIDKWVFSATLSWLDQHQHQLPNTRQVNLNLSGVSLNDDKFIDELFALLERFEHVAPRLCVEITEGVALQDLQRTRQFMQRLQAKGVRIALDDFGAGYTSFSYLRELPADALKIDGALIKDMLKNDSNTAIVRTIVELARNLEMRSIAEWVEDVETLKVLHAMGVDHIQGFIISTARNPNDILGARDLRDLVRSEAAVELLNQLDALK